MRLIFTGDLFIGGDFLNKEFSKKNFDKVLFNKFKKSDYLITNFENIIGKFNTVRKNRDSLLYCTLKTFESYVKFFPNSIFCLGNNHINDFGALGFNETIRILKSYNIGYYGAGLLEEAQEPLIIEDKVIILHFSTDEFFVNSKISSENQIGCCKYAIDEIKELLADINLEGKILIITLHWGYENIILPSPEQVNLAHQLIELGADLIIGTHPHLIQIYEQYKNKYIFYSLGNYFFPNFYRFISGKYIRWREINKRSFFVLIDVLEDNNIKVSFNGLLFNSRKFRIEIDEKSLEFLTNISNSFQKIYKNRNYEEFFNKYLIRHYPPFLKKKQKSAFLQLIFNFLKKNNKNPLKKKIINIINFHNLKKIKKIIVHRLT